MSAVGKINPQLPCCAAGFKLALWRLQYAGFDSCHCPRRRSQVLLSSGAGGGLDVGAQHAVRLGQPDPSLQPRHRPLRSPLAPRGGGLLRQRSLCQRPRKPLGAEKPGRREGDLVVGSGLSSVGHEKSTFFSGRGQGVVRANPAFCPELREVFLGVLGETQFNVHDGGVYGATVGPRMGWEPRWSA